MTNELTYEQQQFVRQCISRWAWIRFSAMTPEERHKHATTVTQVSADIDHSSLLSRLMLGKKPFKYAPPRAMSYPWYSLLEETGCKSCYAIIHETPTDWFPYSHVNLEQGIWKIVAKNEDGSYICEWTDGHPWQVRLEQMTKEELDKKTDTWRQMKNWQDWSWKVTLLSDVEYLD